MNSITLVQKGGMKRKGGGRNEFTGMVIDLLFSNGLRVTFEFLLKTISRLLSTRAEISRLSGRPWKKDDQEREERRRVHIAGRRRRRYRQWMSRMSRMFAAPSNETRYSRRQSSDNLVVAIVATVLVENRFVNQFFTASFQKSILYILYIYIQNYRNNTINYKNVTKA